MSKPARQPRKGRTSEAPRPIRSIGFLLVPGFSLMSYAAAVEPLRAANQIAGSELYRWAHFASGDASVVASSGAAILPDDLIGSDAGRFDLMLVCAGGNPATFNHRPTLSWLRRLARHGMIIGGISGGPFVMAKAGLLQGRRCTLHWEHIPAFEQEFPDVELTRSLFEIDGDRITCSGGISALDMMVALIGRDHGTDFARTVSEWFLHTHVREGMGPQRMDLRFRFGITNEPLLAALKAMEDNIDDPLSRDRLAAIASMSLRQLERSFRRELGRGIHAHYLALRLSQSRRLLRETALPVREVALATGFGSSSQFSRAFKRVYGFSPRRAGGVGAGGGKRCDRQVALGDRDEPFES